MRWLVCVALFAWVPARAHQGGQPVNAQFSKPAPPVTTAADMGIQLSPFTFESADTSYDVAWADMDMDPTGKFTFYYLDHEPTFGVRAEEIETLATLVEEVGKPGLPVEIYASDTCMDGPGIMCPDLGTRDARNGFTWNTAAIPNGTYWVIALNNDPPFKLYNPSAAPVRIAHGAEPLPPAAFILRPDGFGSYDKSYKVQWAAAGKAPLKFDLSYGSGEAGEVLGPTTSIAKNVAPTVNADGTFTYDWDVSKLSGPKVYFLRVTVTDADGKQTYTDSRYGLSVYHPAAVPDMGTAIGDAAIPDLSQPENTGCEVADHPPAPTVFTPLLLALLAIAALLRLARRN
jgi:MYXO-CTERM domain-containing protein